MFSRTVLVFICYFMARLCLCDDTEWRPITQPTVPALATSSSPESDTPSAEPLIQLFGGQPWYRNTNHGRPPSLTFGSSTGFSRPGYQNRIDRRAQTGLGRQTYQNSNSNGHVVNRNRLRRPLQQRRTPIRNVGTYRDPSIAGYGGSSISRMDPMDYSDYTDPPTEQGTLKAALDTLWSHKEYDLNKKTGSQEQVDVSDTWIDILKNHRSPADSKRRNHYTVPGSYQDEPYPGPGSYRRDDPYLGSRTHRQKPYSGSYNNNPYSMQDLYGDYSYTNKVDPFIDSNSYNDNSYLDFTPSVAINTRTEVDLDPDIDFGQKANWRRSKLNEPVRIHPRYQNSRDPGRGPYFRGSGLGSMRPQRFWGTNGKRRTGSSRWIRSGQFEKRRLPVAQLARSKDSDMTDDVADSRLGVADEDTHRPTPKYSDFLTDDNLQHIGDYDYDYAGEYVYDDVQGEQGQESQVIRDVLQPPPLGDTSVGTSSQLFGGITGIVDRVSDTIPFLSDLPSLTSIPRLDTAVTVMSFLAFSVFVTNLAVKALINGTSLLDTSTYIQLFGREETDETINQLTEDMTFLLHQDDAPPVNVDQLKTYLDKLPFDLDVGWTRNMNVTSVLKAVQQMLDVANVVYSNLHDIAQLGVSNFKETLGLQELDDVTSHAPLAKQRIDTGGTNLSVSCTRRLLCHAHQLAAPKQEARAAFTLLPYWTFGMGWLTTKGEETPRLLENLRAEVAGQIGKNCRNLYPTCPESTEFHSILVKLKKDFQTLEDEEILPRTSSVFDKDASEADVDPTDKSGMLNAMADKIKLFQSPSDNFRKVSDSINQNNPIKINDKFSSSFFDNSPTARSGEVEKKKNVVKFGNEEVLIETLSEDSLNNRGGGGYFPPHSYFIKT